MKSLISVVVPIYNVSSYLEKCVKSILAQSYPNIEVILVDDGSIDRSPEICDNFAKMDNRVHVIHKVNGGLVSARKAGFSAASGEYIMTVDGDDWIESGMCEGLLDAIENSGTECAFSGYIQENKIGDVCAHPVDDKVLFFDDCVRSSVMSDWISGKSGLIFSLWGKLFSSKLIKQSYFNVPESMSQGEDYVNFINLVALVKSVIFTSNTYYHYVYRDNSYSHSKALNSIADLFSMATYCRNEMLREYPNLEKKLVDAWVIRECIGYLGRLDRNSRLPFHRYFFKETELLCKKKIMIYGAGIVGKDYLVQLSEHANFSIVGCVDRNYAAYSYKWLNVEPVSSLYNKSYDIILIAVKDERIAMEIKRELCTMGIDETLIIWREPAIF